MLLIPIPNCDYTARRARPSNGAACSTADAATLPPLARVSNAFLSLVYYTKRLPSRKEELKRAFPPLFLFAKRYFFLFLLSIMSRRGRFPTSPNKIDKAGNI
jgi:hypothetical protein